MRDLLRLPPQATLTLPCPRCRGEAGLQTFDLVTVDQERHIHQYMCRRCGRNERLTTEMANDLAEKKESR